MSDTHLKTWLQDHLALATGARELARRTLDENRERTFSGPLELALDHFQAEQERLTTILAALGSRPSTLKRAAVWLGEKIGRLKPNDQITGYSTLSRVEEMEGLLMAAELLGLGWRALQRTRSDDPVLAEWDLSAMIEESDHVLDRLRDCWLEAVEIALVPEAV